MPPSKSQKERDEWTKFESTIAAILTVAQVSGQRLTAAGVYEAYGDMVQVMRKHGDVVNPPTHGTIRNSG